MFAPPVAQSKSAVQHPSAAASRPGRAGGQRDRTPGNQALLRMSAPRAGVAQPGARLIQPKLAIGAVDDPLEHEADRIAEQVMRMPAAGGAPMAAPVQVSRKCDACAAKEDQEELRRKPAATPSEAAAAPATVHDVLRSPGQPLDRGTRAYFEPRFGRDFSSVRVYRGASAERSAQDLHAHAYTVGANIVFGAGQFAPGAPAGRRLIAHELAHVVQQSGASGLTIQRQEQKPDPAGAKKATQSPAAAAPKLSLTPSKNGSACACLLVVHNDERNARKTAALMHEHCAYNLALVEPDTAGRLIKVPGQKAPADPNSLFPRHIAEMCLDNEQECRDFLTDKAATTDRAELEKLVQIQFFLAVDDCSSKFALPVVALHNNDIEDTKNYLKEKDKQGVGDLKLDVDKSKKETGEDQIKKLKELMKKKFGAGVEKETMETAGKTNIFRWCAAKDLSRCHIGDPDHPDNVVWVTNQKDFEALSKKDINVALQSDATKAAGSESEGDLSTLFLLINDILNVRLVELLDRLTRQEKVDWEEIDRIFAELDRLTKSEQLTDLELLIDLIQILILLFEIMIGRARAGAAPAETTARVAKLRYINIESPGKRLADQSNPERVRNYEAIVEVLSTAGLHCCGDDPKIAEGKIKAGLEEPKAAPSGR